MLFRGAAQVSVAEFHSAIRHCADFSIVRDRHVLMRMEKLVTQLAAAQGLTGQSPRVPSGEPRGGPDSEASTSIGASTAGPTPAEKGSGRKSDGLSRKRDARAVVGGLVSRLDGSELELFRMFSR